jgi:hypothetical protein
MLPTVFTIELLLGETSWASFPSIDGVDPTTNAVGVVSQDSRSTLYNITTTRTRAERFVGCLTPLTQLEQVQ